MLSTVIQAVAGDRGGWNAIYPVLIHAADQGCTVEVILVGACAQQVTDKKLEIDSRFTVTINPSLEKIKHVSGAEKNTVMVLGMSQSKEGLEAIATAALSTSVPIFGVQDYYGSAIPLLKTLQKENKLHVMNVLCVNDEIAQKHIIEEGFVLHDLAVTGSPHFDHVVQTKTQWNNHRDRLRNILGLSDEEMLFLVVGQPNGTAEIMHVLEKGISLDSTQEKDRILVRMHPRATLENQRAMEEYYTSTAYKRFITIPQDSKLTTDDLLPASDFVLSGYSTTNHIAVLYEMPGVIYVKTPLLQKDLLKDTGLSKPMEVQSRAAWYVSTPEEVAHVVKEVLSKEPSQEILELKINQQKIARYNDGLATQRCWEKLQTLLII